MKKENLTEEQLIFQDAARHFLNVKLNLIMKMGKRWTSIT